MTMSAACAAGMCGKCSDARCPCPHHPPPRDVRPKERHVPASLPTKKDIRTAERVLAVLPELVYQRRCTLEHGLREAAEQIGLSYPSLSRLENRLDANPQLETITGMIHYVLRGKK